MTHQMPVPQAAQSPYPLQPAPLPKASSRRNAGQGTTGPDGNAWSLRAKIGMGAALGLASAIAATFYFRRRQSAATA